jgi:hypothetical protein
VSEAPPSPPPNGEQYFPQPDRRAFRSGDAALPDDKLLSGAALVSPSFWSLVTHPQGLPGYLWLLQDPPGAGGDQEIQGEPSPRSLTPLSQELGYTPLMRAAKNDDEASVRMLLQSGHDPSKRNIVRRPSPSLRSHNSEGGKVASGPRDGYRCEGPAHRSYQHQSEPGDGGVICCLTCRTRSRVARSALYIALINTAPSSRPLLRSSDRQARPPPSLPWSVRWRSRGCGSAQT